MREFITAQNEAHYLAAADLFREYASSIGIDLCFQNFEKELRELPVMYDPKYGGIIMCLEEDEFIASIAVRRIDDATCELKRMYVKPGYRGKGIASGLLRQAIELASAKGYSKMRLDTLATMTSAIALYRRNGFYEIPAYYFNPESNVVYLERKL